MAHDIGGTRFLNNCAARPTCTCTARPMSFRDAATTSARACLTKKIVLEIKVHGGLALNGMIEFAERLRADGFSEDDLRRTMVAHQRHLLE